MIWEVRESGLGATAFVPGAAGHLARLGGFRRAAGEGRAVLRDLRSLFKKFGYKASLYGHFGQGCIHTRMPFDLTTPRRHREAIASSCMKPRSSA